MASTAVLPYPSSFAQAAPPLPARPETRPLSEPAFRIPGAIAEPASVSPITSADSRFSVPTAGDSNLTASRSASTSRSMTSSSNSAGAPANAADVAMAVASAGAPVVGRWCIERSPRAAVAGRDRR
ncbi:hypothetical protein ACRJ4W_53590 [Streptomyces sp. GLT-R25]